MLRPELKDKLDIYEGLLRKWQASINLISPTTLPDITKRHFEDSLQLMEYIPVTARRVFDFGSGAGFPGMVIAMTKPELDVHLVESDQKKASFLKTVSRETETKVTVHNCRIEELKTKTPLIPDIITARALASLPRLLDYVAPWAQTNRRVILIAPKGQAAEEELEEANKNYRYDVQQFASRTEKEAQILVIKDIFPRA